ncbi:hypothetical protein MLD38_022253 [Melastoma candidum]|uniref:Uncharacterized protein n=1 Tax=Melastoma candidum TaxID=119954 RepID=A0ACB9QJ60_9MYRT|nr:hypothetical protein MLD38_022253 [Melastoma candidum]
MKDFITFVLKGGLGSGLPSGSAPRVLVSPPTKPRTRTVVSVRSRVAAAARRSGGIRGLRMQSDATSFNLILGSASGARRKVLDDMGYEFTVVTADIDEKAIRKDDPEDLVMALAEAKAEAICQRLPRSDYNTDLKPTLLITCDQVAVYEGAVREKPSSEEEAREFLRGYSGGYAATVSGVLVTNLKSGTRKGGLDRVEIHFNEIPNEVIEALIAEGIVLKSAGGLIIEHPSIVPYVKQVAGTTDSVMGLPKALTEKLIKDAL